MTLGKFSEPVGYLVEVQQQIEAATSELIPGLIDWARALNLPTEEWEQRLCEMMHPPP